MSHGPVLPVVALHCTPLASSVTHGDVSDWSNHSVYTEKKTTIFTGTDVQRDGRSARGNAFVDSLAGAISTGFFCLSWRGHSVEFRDDVGQAATENPIC